MSWGKITQLLTPQSLCGVVTSRGAYHTQLEKTPPFQDNSSSSHNPCMLCNLSYLLIFFQLAITNAIVPCQIWGFHSSKWYILKYSIKFFIFFQNYFFKIINISENNVISVKLAHVLQYYLYELNVITNSGMMCPTRIFVDWYSLNCMFIFVHIQNWEYTSVGHIQVYIRV